MYRKFRQHLTPEWRWRVRCWLADKPAPRELYAVKEAINRLYRVRGHRRASKALTLLTDAMAYSLLPEVQTLRTTLLRWRPASRSARLLAPEDLFSVTHQRVRRASFWSATSSRSDLLQLRRRPPKASTTTTTSGRYGTRVARSSGSSSRTRAGDTFPHLAISSVSDRNLETQVGRGRDKKLKATEGGLRAPQPRLKQELDRGIFDAWCRRPSPNPFPGHASKPRGSRARMAALDRLGSGSIPS
jgi:hypothetical protein